MYLLRNFKVNVPGTYIDTNLSGIELGGGNGGKGPLWSLSDIFVTAEGAEKWEL